MYQTIPKVLTFKLGLGIGHFHEISPYNNCWGRRGRTVYTRENNQIFEEVWTFTFVKKKFGLVTKLVMKKKS